MTATAPRICCLDLDTFFVSVERILDPSLEGRPVIVGGRPGQRGVVTACSYEVRKAGVRSGMSLTEAARLAPDAVYLPVRQGVYSDYSEKVRDIAARYTPTLRVASIDELYMDFRGCERLYQRPQDGNADDTILRVVRELTAAIREELGLPASAGIATSKSVAKIATTLAKPAGVRMVRAGQEAALLGPLPVRRLPGIGPVGEAKLQRQGILTLGELAETPLPKLRRVFGAWAGQVKRNANGKGRADLGRDRPAFREHHPEGEVLGSISNERTFRTDVEDTRVIQRMLCQLCERVCWRARKRGVQARTVTLKLRYADFATFTRSRSLSPTASELELYPVLLELYDRCEHPRDLPVRLLGVALSNLGFHDQQLSLFTADRSGLHATVDDLRARFGFDVLRLASGRDKP